MAEEKHVGVIAVEVDTKENIAKFNSVLTEYDDIILGRQGLPFRDRDYNIISLVVECSDQQIVELEKKVKSLSGIKVLPSLICDV